jgi:GTP-binding protein
MGVPVVAVVGRPNVGKSTLVNRLAGVRDAIVHETSGVTRDRSYHRADWNGREFMLIDTGGIEFATDDAFGDSIRAQALAAASEADVVVFMVDGRTGIVAGDEDVATIMKRSAKPVVLVVNKLDDPRDEEALHGFWNLGLGQPHPVSSVHGHGSGDLLDAVVGALPEPDTADDTDSISVAIVGRPNAGKSSLLNRLAGADRVIVSEVPGTTRDAVDTLVEHEGTRYRLVDTAGLRRRAQIDEPVEYYGFLRAMRAMDRADVSLLVVDCGVGITAQDQRVVSFAAEKGCALVILLNKWDLLLDEEARERLEGEIPRKLGFVSYAPVLRVSALSGRGVQRVFSAIDAVYDAYTQKLSTRDLNTLLTALREEGHTVTKHGKTLRLAYVTQTHERPPGFTFFANHPTMIDPTYRRYLENRMRERFDLTGTPVILKFKAKT